MTLTKFWQILLGLNNVLETSTRLNKCNLHISTTFPRNKTKLNSLCRNLLQHSVNKKKKSDTTHLQSSLEFPEWICTCSLFVSYDNNYKVAQLISNKDFCLTLVSISYAPFHILIATFKLSMAIMPLKYVLNILHRDQHMQTYELRKEEREKRRLTTQKQVIPLHTQAKAMCLV